MLLEVLKYTMPTSDKVQWLFSTVKHTKDCVKRLLTPMKDSAVVQTARKPKSVCDALAKRELGTDTGKETSSSAKGKSSAEKKKQAKTKQANAKQNATSLAKSKPVENLAKAQEAVADHIVSVNGKTRKVVVLDDLINAISYTVEHCVSPKTDAILEATHMGLEFIFTKKLDVETGSSKGNGPRITNSIRGYKALRREIKRRLLRQHALKPRVSDPDLNEKTDDAEVDVDVSGDGDAGKQVTDGSPERGNQGAAALVRRILHLIESKPTLVRESAAFMNANPRCKDVALISRRGGSIQSSCWTLFFVLVKKVLRIDTRTARTASTVVCVWNDTQQS